MKKYIEKVKKMIRIFPPRQEGQSKEEYAKQRVFLGLKYGAFLLAAFAVLRGVLVAAGENVTVSNSVDGRELPIYCVDTQEKKIALSFDAAWGNEDTAKILEVLKKHDVHVTFFMTGGWVGRWAYMKKLKLTGAVFGTELSVHRTKKPYCNISIVNDLLEPGTISIVFGAVILMAGSLLALALSYPLTVGIFRKNIEINKHIIIRPLDVAWNHILNYECGIYKTNGTIMLIIMNYS